MGEGTARLEAEPSGHTPSSCFLTATWSFVCDFILHLLEASWKTGFSLPLDRFTEQEPTQGHTPVEEPLLLISDDVSGSSFSLMVSWRLLGFFV